MARRKDSSLGGRPLAGEFGDLFLITDGMSAVWDSQQREVYSDPQLARAAWERARRMTWKHEDRDGCWPPEGAIAYDGITAKARQVHPDAETMAAAVDADIASVEAFRQREPAAAAQIADELEEYVTGLQLLAGMWASVDLGDVFARGDAMQKAMDRKGADRGTPQEAPAA